MRPFVFTDGQVSGFQCLFNTRTVSRINFIKQVELAFLRFRRSVLKFTCDAAKHALMFFVRQQVEQQTRLSEIVLVFAVIPVIGSTFNRQRGFAEVRLFLEQTGAVWLIRYAVAAVAVDTHGAITVVVMERAFWCVNRDLMMVDAQTVAVRIAVREQTAL